MSDAFKRWGVFASRPAPQALALAALGVLAISLQWPQPYTREFLGFDAGLLLLSVCLPYVTRSVLQAFDKLPGLVSSICAENPPEVEEAPLSKRSRRVALWASGLALAVFGVATSGSFGVPWTGAAKVVSALWLVIALFGYGALAYLYGLHMWVLWDLGKVQVKCQVFEWPREEIQALYQVYSGLLAWGAALYVIAIASVWSSPGVWLVDRLGAGDLQGRAFHDFGWGSSWLVLESLWVFPAGVMVILFFLLFHLRCHKLLAQCRDQAVRRLSLLASQKLEAWSLENTKEHLETADRFLTWREKIRGERVWPLDLRAAIATFTTLLVPAIKTVMELSG